LPTSADTFSTEPTASISAQQLDIALFLGDHRSQRLGYLAKKYRSARVGLIVVDTPVGIAFDQLQQRAPRPQWYGDGPVGGVVALPSAV